MSPSGQPMVENTSVSWPAFAPWHLSGEQPVSVNLSSSCEDFPGSWSQLLRDEMIAEDEEKKMIMKEMETKKQVFNPQTSSSSYGWSGVEADVKQEKTSTLDLRSSKPSDRKHPNSNLQSYNKSTGSVKKPKVEARTSGQGAFKVQVRKEKLGDRINALHQLVSPFGKTDAASVLLEAIGYIKFLQSQIQTLSLPYMGSHRSARSSSSEECAGDLRSRGLCLVPISGSLVDGAEAHGSDHCGLLPLR